MKAYAPMRVSTVGMVAEVIMGGRKHSGRGGGYSSRRSYSDSRRPRYPR